MVLEDAWKLDAAAGLVARARASNAKILATVKRDNSTGEGALEEDRTRGLEGTTTRIKADIENG